MEEEMKKEDAPQEKTSEEQLTEQEKKEEQKKAMEEMRKQQMEQQKKMMEEQKKMKKMQLEMTLKQLDVNKIIVEKTITRMKAEMEEMERIDLEKAEHETSRVVVKAKIEETGALVQGEELKLEMIALNKENVEKQLQEIDKMPMGMPGMMPGMGRGI